MSFKDQNVVITGGHGFIGKHLAAALWFDGANVLRISRKTIIKLDLETDPLDEFLEKLSFSPNYIIHLASVVGGIHYLKQHQAHTLQKNMAILSNSFKNIEKYPDLKGQVFMSSVCAYPQELQTWSMASAVTLSEERDNAYNPDSTYGWSKLMGEMLIQHYFKEFNVPGMSIRLFNTYGPHENFNTESAHVIPALLMKAYEYPKNPFSVLGDGSQIRAFLYIADAVDAILKALLSNQNGDIINVGDTTPYTIKEVVDLVIEVSNKDIEPIFSDQDAVGAKGRLPDITRAKELLNWSPTRSLQDGLKETYKWLKERE